MVKTKLEISEDQFYDLLWILKIQHESDFYGFHSKPETLRVYKFLQVLIRNAKTSAQPFLHFSSFLNCKYCLQKRL
jgi:hypothetical protein